ncbi:MAG: SufB/SufD family protein [Candidatus Heimdallarchaeaceae archaeon]
MPIDRKKEFEQLMDLFEKDGGDAQSIKENLGASMVLNKDEVIHARDSEGVTLKANKIPNGVDATITVKAGHIEEKPVHLCFGMLPKEGKQVIKSKIIVGKGAKVKILSHCIFPNAVHIQHIMDGEIIIEEGAELTYEEEHYHSEDGFVEVVPHQIAIVEKNGRYFNNFYMKNGRVGKLDIDYTVKLKERAIAELITKIYAKQDDVVVTREKIDLEGEKASGLILSRVVLRDKSKSEFIGITEGFAPNTQAHVDCSEIIMDQATASAIPEIRAHHPTCKLTHEAAIGQIDQKQLNTLLAKGLTEEKAIEYLVNGILR